MKDVSGAAFEGASVGVFMGSDARRLEIENARNRPNPEISPDFILVFFTLTFFSEIQSPSGY
jgi:hypothetical protein